MSQQPTPRVSLVFLGLATALAIIDATIINVALPAVSRDLGLSLTSGEWVVSGYGLTLAALLISAGRLADRFGQRRLLVYGTVGFAAASLLCGLAPTGGVLIAGRFLQGATAAALLPTVLSLINATFRGPALSTAFAVYGATIGSAAALGPLLGSALVNTLGWRWAFFVNLPLAAVVVAGVVRTVPVVPGRRRDGSDPLAQVLLLLGLALLVFGLIEAPRTGWITPTRTLDLGPLTWPADRSVSASGVALAIAVVSLAALVLLERFRQQRGRPTLIDVSLFSIASFRAGTLAVLVVALGEFGILFLLPLYLQAGRGLSPLQAQLVVLPTALGSFISAPITARRAGTPARTWVLVGLAIEVAGLLLAGAVLGPTMPVALLALPLLIYGTGVGFAISQLSGASLLDIPFPRLGQASGVSSTARQIGSAVGVAVLTAILSGVLGTTLADRIAREAPTLAPSQRTAVASAIAASPADPSAIRALDALPPAVRDGVQKASTESLALGVRLAALAAAVPIAGALMLSLRLPAARPDPATEGAPASPRSTTA